VGILVPFGDFDQAQGHNLARTWAAIDPEPLSDIGQEAIVARRLAHDRCRRLYRRHAQHHQDRHKPDAWRAGSGGDRDRRPRHVFRRMESRVRCAHTERGRARSIGIDRWTAVRFIE
jgi:hypothetical protein